MAGDEERLVVLLEARVNDFEKRMKAAERTGSNSFRRLRQDSRTASRQMQRDMQQSTASMNQSLAQATTKIGAFGKAFIGGAIASAATAVFAGITSHVNETVTAIAEMGDAAKRSGLALEAFQEWSFVADQNRIGIDSLIDGFKELSLRADEFIVTGAGSAQEAFTRLGYTATDLKQKLKDPSELMLEIIGRLEGMDKAAQIRIADEVFGGTGGERFVELLSQGEDGLRKTISRAHEAGVVLDEELVQKAAELDRKFSELTAKVSTFGKKLAVALADIPFDMVQTRLNEIFSDENMGRSILGDDVYDALREAGSLTDDQIQSLETLRNRYSAVEEQARSMAVALSGAATTADQMGNDALWEVLAGASNDMRALADEFAQGSIDGQTFATKLDEIRSNASDALSELEGIDQQSFGGVMAQLGALGNVILALIPKAKELKNSLPGSQMGMDTGTGLTVDDIQLPGTASAPTSSPRPKTTPFVGDVVTTDNFDTSTGKGGGGGSSRNVWADRVKSIQEETQALQNEAAALVQAAGTQGAYADAVEYARTRAELLTAAQRQGIEITPEIEGQIDQLAEAYVKAGNAADDAADRLQKIQDQTNAGADAMSNLFMTITEGGDAAKQAMAQLLLQMAQVQMKKALLGLDAAGGGGFLKAVGSMLGYASGGYTGSGGVNEPAGVVHKGEYVFSQRAVQNIGASSLESLHQQARRGSTGSAGGNGGGGGSQQVDVTVSVDDKGGLKTFVEKRSTAIAQQAAASAVGQYDKIMPDRVNYIIRNPWKR
ncbi:phage tail tape measure protein [Thioclava sp. GXIMD4215]|uniref:phage tail tape measure protein n=1 Tax=Thioclava sp. GXIMD4215 TaxID=3131928 RepID=UPI00324315F0